MKLSEYKSYDELPLFLNAAMVAKVLGVSPSSGYELMHEPDFPVLKIGNRMVVPKEKFIGWRKYHWGQVHMRKQKLLIGWPIQDSKRYRFAIPNKIWDYKLKPIAFMIFSYLCYCHSHHPANMVPPDGIARGIHVTISSVRKYSSALVNTGLISTDLSLTRSLQCGKNENFFSLPNEIFLLKLPPSAFMVYAYLLLIEDRKTHTCHPSYNTISAATGMSKNTALKSIYVLLETGLIAVEPSSYFDKRGMKWKGNNLYTILPIHSAVDIFHQRQLRKLELDAARSRLSAQTAV